MFAYFALLVHLGIFSVIEVHFLPVGHTHEVFFATCYENRRAYFENLAWCFFCFLCFLRYTFLYLVLSYYDKTHSHRTHQDIDQLFRAAAEAEAARLAQEVEKVRIAEEQRAGVADATVSAEENLDLSSSQRLEERLMPPGVLRRFCFRLLSRGPRHGY